MQLDTPTALFASAMLTAVMGGATIFYGLARKENRPFLWVGAAPGGFALGVFFISLRGFLPDFFTITLGNLLSFFTLAAFFEGLCRLLRKNPKERWLSFWIMAAHTAAFTWFAHVQPSFQARVVVMSLGLSLLSIFIIRVLLTDMVKSQRSFLVFAAVPFFLILLYNLGRLVWFLIRHTLPADSFQSPAFAISGMIYGMVAVWTGLAVTFIVSNRLQTQVNESAMTDALTGALNRRALRDAAQREIARAKRHRRPLSLIIADLDHFKRVNDVFGHQAGDAVVAHAADLFRKVLREEDVLARYGGDEFVVLVQGADRRAAAEVAERMRSACKRDKPRHDGGTIELSVSFGVAGFGGPPMDWDSLLGMADQALYLAKEQGRDRVVVCEDEPLTPKIAGTPA